MATTVSTPKTPTGFEGLPLEIQREILLKYFEDSCTITFHLKKLRPFLLSLDYKLGREAQIGLVSKHLSDETLLALKQSPHTAIAFHPKVTGWYLNNIEQDSTVVEFTRNIRTIHAQHFFADIGFAPYQKLAPNLRYITLPVEDRKPFHVLGLVSVLNRFTLLDLVQGKSDADVASQIRKGLLELLDAWTPGWHFKGVTLTFSFCFPIESYWMSDAPIGTELRDFELLLTFENMEEKTTIVSKQLQRVFRADCTTRIEATEEVVNRLTVMSQEDLGKAAAELRYLENLPGY